MPRPLALLVLIALAAVVPACHAAPIGELATEPPQGAPAGDAAWEARPVPPELLTVAEKSDYKATARHEEVVALLDRLAAAGPKVARRAEMGTSVEGRSLPMLILADPPVATPEEAAAQVRRGKLVALMIGNIHAGEVDGKEALPMLAREIILTPKHPLLKELILVFVPIYNADGNERVGRDNRPGQLGPEEGMGIRENAQGFDLNRDFIKLEAPETRALVRAMTQWDPALFIDTHTTNGSFHRYPLTYAGPTVPAGDPGVLEYVRDAMLPRIGRAVEEKHGLATFFYGDFAAEHTKWETFPAIPRYATNYFGLRNRIAILTEGYSYAPYKDRVVATLDFVRATLEDLAANKAHVRKLFEEADRASALAGEERAGDAPELRPVVLRVKPAAAPERATVKGFVEERREGRSVSTGDPKDYEVEVWNRSEATLSVPRPFAYLIPAEFETIAENLQRHGIEVEETREDLELEFEVYRIEAVTRAMRAFQGHMLVTVGAERRTETRRVPAGTLLVRTGQKLGSLAAFMLEPQSEDGLATWNFLDEHLNVGGDYPILRVPAFVPITSTRIRPLAEERKPARPITFEEFFEGGRPPSFAGAPVGGISWLDDGEHFLQSKGGKLRKVHAATGRSEVFFDAAPAARALAALPTIGERAARGLADRALGNASKDRSVALINHENDLYFVRLDGSEAGRLTSTPEPEELASLSPDGAFAAFVRGNDLYVVDLQTRTERRLTTDGAETVLNGKADWVYFEEVFGRNWRTYWWSPDSTRLAFLRTDNSRVPLFTLVDDLGERQRVEATRYPRPGEPNPAVQLGIVGVAGGSPAFADLSGYDADSHLITGVGWWPDSSVAYCYVQNRTQTWLDFCTVPTGGGAVKRLFRETTEAWVDAPPAPTFLKDGSFLLASDRTGHRHLYHYAKDGKLRRAVTEGEWDVRTLHGVDEEAPGEGGAWVYISATTDSPIAQNLSRVRLNTGAMERLTHEPGSHRVTLSPKHNAFIDAWSSRRTPTRVALRSTDGGELVRTLDTNPVYALEEFIFGPSEQFQIPTSDGFPMEAAWTLPADFDPMRKYPVWIATYAGPGSATVSDSWGNGGTWDQALATAGVVVLRVDPRSASNKGAKSAWTAYRQLGVQELKDLVDAVKWLKTHDWVDGARIGLSGHSYGGFMTAYALTHSDVFAAGIAGAPVTDWREYDTIYTERYMSTPQDNPEGYDKTSAVKGAAKLKGRLLIIHGLMDDNVHPSNTWKLVNALQRANKQFDLAIYPPNRHGIGGRQYQRMMYDFILRTVGSSSAAPAQDAEEGEDAAGAVSGVSP